MATRRNVFPITRFRGHYDRGRSPMDQDIFARKFYLSECYNYHLSDGLRKRKGDTPLADDPVSGTDPINGLAMYEWDTTRYLIATSGGQLKKMDGSGWTDIRGSLSLVNESSNYLRTCHFHDGASRYIVGCDGPSKSQPWMWPGTGNATAFSGTNKPAYASDVASFHGHLFFINTDAGPYSITWTKYGTIDTHPDNNILDCTRDSLGMALSAHSDETLLAIYQTGVYAIRYNYNIGQTSNAFTSTIIDGTVGTPARASVVSKEGCTYFASWDGIHRVRRLDGSEKPVQDISQPIKKYWRGLNRNRIPHIYAWASGCFPEIYFLVSTDNTPYHNAVLVWNYEEEGWSIFNSENNLIDVNCGGVWRDSNGIDMTLIGSFTDSMVSKAWGDDEVDSGVRDGGVNGGPVRAEFTTGYLDLGYRGQKALREVWYDADVTGSITFQCQIDTAATRQVANREVDMGESGDLLGVNFVLGVSRLAAGLPNQARAQIKRSGRYFRLNSAEVGTQEPHTIFGIYFAHVRQGTIIE